MNSKIIFIAVVLFSVAINSCKEEDEFNIELISGEYTGIAYYYSSVDTSGGQFIRSDPSKVSDFKVMIRKNSSNFILSFNQSFNYKIPDISIEIEQLEKYPNIAFFTTLPGQAYSIAHRERTLYASNNFLYFEKSPRAIHFNFTLKSNDPDSTTEFIFNLVRLY